MQMLIELVNTRATDILFNVSIVVIAYVFARLASARGTVALALAFSPLIVVWALDNGLTRSVFTGHI